MSTDVRTTPVVTHDPISAPGYGACLYCGGPAGFLAHEGPFCCDDCVSSHRQSEQTSRDTADNPNFVAFLRAVSR